MGEKGVSIDGRAPRWASAYHRISSIGTERTGRLAYVIPSRTRNMNAANCTNIPALLSAAASPAPTAAESTNITIWRGLALNPNMGTDLSSHRERLGHQAIPAIRAAAP